MNTGLKNFVRLFFRGFVLHDFNYEEKDIENDKSVSYHLEKIIIQIER